MPAPKTSALTAVNPMLGKSLNSSSNAGLTCRSCRSGKAARVRRELGEGLPRWFAGAIDIVGIKPTSGDRPSWRLSRPALWPMADAVPWGSWDGALSTGPRLSLTIVVRFGVIRSAYLNGGAEWAYSALTETPPSRPLAWCG
jgi:hypothetical protein